MHAPRVKRDGAEEMHVVTGDKACHSVAADISGSAQAVRCMADGVVCPCDGFMSLLCHTGQEGLSLGILLVLVCVPVTDNGECFVICMDCVFGGFEEKVNRSCCCTCTVMRVRKTSLYDGQTSWSCIQL